MINITIDIAIITVSITLISLIMAVYFNLKNKQKSDMKEEIEELATITRILTQIEHLNSKFDELKGEIIKRVEKIEDAQIATESRLTRLETNQRIEEVDII